jgi:hypothetical protein
MLRVPVDDIDGEGYEQLWTRRLPGGNFEVCCIPFFAYDLALGDVVFSSADQNYVVDSVVARSGNGVARVAIKDSTQIEVIHSLIHETLGRAGYLHEWFRTDYVAINLKPNESHDELFGKLDALGDAIEDERFLSMSPVSGR